RRIGTLKFGASCNTIVLRSGSENRLERGDHGRIELGLDRLREPKPCDPTWHRLTVRPIRGHCVVCVGYGDNPREQGNILSSETVRVTLTVDPLMMVPHHSGDFRVRVNVRKDSLSNFRVALHLASLIERQRAGLLEQTSRKSDLPDVVNEAAQVSEFPLLEA